MKIITVFRSYHTDGYTGRHGGIYRTKNEARLASDYPDHPSSDMTGDAFQALQTDDGKVWLLDKDGPCMFTEDSAKLRANALAKLTQAEKEILGLA